MRGDPETRMAAAHKKGCDMASRSHFLALLLASRAEPRRRRFGIRRPPLPRWSLIFPRFLDGHLIFLQVRCGPMAMCHAWGRVTSSSAKMNDSYGLPVAWCRPISQVRFADR